MPQRRRSVRATRAARGLRRPPQARLCRAFPADTRRTPAWPSAARLRRRPSKRVRWHVAAEGGAATAARMVGRRGRAAVHPSGPRPPSSAARTPPRPPLRAPALRAPPRHVPPRSPPSPRAAPPQFPRRRRRRAGAPRAPPTLAPSVPPPPICAARRGRHATANAAPASTRATHTAAVPPVAPRCRRPSLPLPPAWHRRPWSLVADGEAQQRRPRRRAAPRSPS